MQVIHRKLLPGTEPPLQFVVQIGIILLTRRHFFAARATHNGTIQNNEFLWHKRKEHVPERIDLFALTEVALYENEGGIYGRAFFFLSNLLNKDRSRVQGRCQLIAERCHNTPNFTPSMIQKGDVLWR